MSEDNSTNGYPMVKVSYNVNPMCATSQNQNMSPNLYQTSVDFLEETI